MAYEPRDLSGTLFKAEKGDNPSRPDYTGDAMVGGVAYRISAWLKDSQKGGKFLSLSFTIKGENKAAPPAAKPTPKPTPQQALPLPAHDPLDDMMDEVPF